MSIEIHAAIVGGVISGVLAGVVVFAGIAIERRLNDRAEQRRRRQELMAEALRSYLVGVARGLRAARAGDDAAGIVESGDQLVGAAAQMLVFGPARVAGDLLNVIRWREDLATPQAQDALIDLFVSIRSEVLPGESEFDRETIRGLLFVPT
jgi:hypothetical protein